MLDAVRVALYLSEVETADLRAEVARRDDLYRAGRCYRCNQWIGACDCRVGRVSVPPATAREPVDVRRQYTAADEPVFLGAASLPFTGTVPADVPVGDAVNPYATIDNEVE